MGFFGRGIVFLAQAGKYPHCFSLHLIGYPLFIAEAFAERKVTLFSGVIPKSFSEKNLFGVSKSIFKAWFCKKSENSLFSGVREAQVCDGVERFHDDNLSGHLGTCFFGT